MAFVLSKDAHTCVSTAFSSRQDVCALFTRVVALGKGVGVTPRLARFCSWPGCWLHGLTLYSKPSEVCVLFSVCRFKNRTKWPYEAHLLKGVYKHSSFKAEASSAFCPDTLRPSQNLTFSYFFNVPGIAGTSDIWDREEKNILDHLLQEQLRDYGQDYILHQTKFNKSIGGVCNPDLSPVLQDIQHAISAQNPAPF